MNNIFLKFTYLCFSIAIISCDTSEESVVENSNVITSAQVAESNLDNDLILKLVNEVREKGCNCTDKNGLVTKMPPVGLLTWNNDLTRAAKLHSDDMYKNNYFSHTNLQNKSSGDRLTAIGYAWSYASENIAKGQKSEKGVFDAWMNSYGHCKNIMFARVKEMGVARTVDSFYWTQLFATKKGS